MSIKKIVEFKGTMTSKSGVHIGGNGNGTEVGGCDNPVIRNPLTNAPYIPGSSIKGALRSCAEKMPAYAGKIRNGKPCGCGQETCMVCKLFGAHMNTRADSGEPRLIVRDMNLNQEFLDKITTSGGSHSDIVETKVSTMIDRVTNTAATGPLRNMERVAAGAVFDCSFVLKVTDKDKEVELIDFLKKCIKLVEATGIGGKVTSGSGQVKFDIDWDSPCIITL